MVTYLWKECSESTFTKSKRFSLYCIKKGYIISYKLYFSFDKNDNIRNAPEELRRILKMVFITSVMLIPQKLQQHWERIVVIAFGIKRNCIKIYNNIYVVTLDYMMYYIGP